MLLGKRSGKHLIFRMDKDEIRLAVLNLSSSDPVPECSTVIETPEGAIEDGDLKRPDLLEEALKAVLSQPEYKKIKKAIFTICTGQVISETVTIPAVSEKKLEKMLQANLDMYFPVSTAEHHLVYHILDKLEGEEGKEMLVQLWAIPRDMIVSYYALAKLLGVAVTAIDYCGNSLVSSVGATFAVPEERDAKGKKPKKEKKPSRFGKKKKAEQDETYQPGLTSEEPVEEEQEAVPTEVYLSLEEEHIIATFVQKNQVKMQRVFLTGYSVAAELDEVRLTLDYFTSLEGADPEKMTAVLCGKLASDPMIVGDVESALDLPVSVWNCPGGPEWTLNVGAAKSRKDFGIADVAKSMKGANPLQERWQIYALLASAVLLISSVALTVFSNLGWDLDLASLDDTLRIMKIQEAQNNGNAERYYEYESKYDAYSYDWDVMFSSLRTYNDNLVKMLEEVERTIPKDAAVVTIGIADEGLGLQFACEDKEMAAYLIMSLRDLKYATLSDISNLSVGPGATAQDMLPSLSQRNQMTGAQGGFMQGFQDGFNETFNGEEGAPGTGEDAPKTGASNMSISELMALAESMGIDIDSLTMQEKLQLYQMYQNGELDQYLGGSGSTATKQDPILVAGAAIKTGKITKDDVEEAIEDLTVHQKDILEGAYGATPKPKHDMAYMRKHYKSLKPRQEAIDTMLTTDEFAAYRFHLAFMEDLS
ncbi:MAG: pilus assembly protein PilM, partial [Firmicutes bacterium]|nr:pilus assembly protein PilM [Bacillota bacterium]